jgi:hypothetical protein
VTILTFFSWVLVTIVGVTVLWPLNIPLAALAYKVRQGNQPVPLEPGPFWYRSTFAALGLAVLSLVFIGLASLLTRGAGLPRDAVYLVLLLAYLPLGTWYVFWMFALEDMFQGLSVFCLYILIPGLPLALIVWLTGLWKTIAKAFL